MKKDAQYTKREREIEREKKVIDREKRRRNKLFQVLGIKPCIPNYCKLFKCGCTSP